jgi:hypothetical protein
MKRATLSARDRALLDEVRELVRALGAHLSLELEDRLAALEELVRQRRTVVIRRPFKPRPKPPEGSA